MRMGAPKWARRVRRAFLLIPKQIEGESKWLEWACWEEWRFVYGARGQWSADRWIEEATYDRLSKLGPWYIGMSGDGHHPVLYPLSEARLVGAQAYIDALKKRAIR